MSTIDYRLERNAFGRLVFTAADGTSHDGVMPVRAFPLLAPGEGLSLVSAEGRELAWIARLAELPAPMRTLLEEELAAREFTPRITRIRSVSTFSTPSTWALETDRGAASLVLKAEEDIRRLGGGRLLIADAQGLQFEVPDLLALDRHSKRLIERFL